MAPSKTANRKRLQKLLKAFNAYEQGESITNAAKMVNLKRSTFYYKYRNRSIVIKALNNQPTFRRTQLTEQEAETILSVCQHYADRGHPLSLVDIADAAEIVISCIDEDRRSALRFTNGRPGVKWLKGFRDRHKEKIAIGTPSPQEEERWEATNAEVLTTHIAALESIIRTHKIPPSHIANLDETSVTLNRDTKGRLTGKLAMRRSLRHARGKGQLRMAAFKNVSRVTMMPVVFADGSCGRPLFIIEGQIVPYRTIDANGFTVTQSLADCLPTGSYITSRKEIAGVDKFIFERWARDYVEETASLRTDDRKILLIYDGYRSHMGIKVLEILRSANIIAYALPAHTIGSTQPLDVSVFNSLKHHLRQRITDASKFVDRTDYSIFDLCLFMRSAYECSFTRDNILSSFRKAGISPIGTGELLNVPRSLSREHPSQLVSVEQLINSLEKKKVDVRHGLNLQVPVLRRGFVDTSAGLTLTTDAALDLIRKKENAERVKKVRDALKNTAQEKKELLRMKKVKEARLRDEEAALRRCVALYHVPMKPSRSISERRLVARRRVQEKRLLLKTA